MTLTVTPSLCNWRSLLIVCSHGRPKAPKSQIRPVSSLAEVIPHPLATKSTQKFVYVSVFKSRLNTFLFACCCPSMNDEDAALARKQTDGENKDDSGARILTRRFCHRCDNEDRMLEYLWSCIDECDVLLPPGRSWCQKPSDPPHTSFQATLSDASVSSWSGGIEHFFKIAFTWSEKRFFWPPGARWPCCSSEYKMRRGSRLYCIRMHSIEDWLQWTT